MGKGNKHRGGHDRKKEDRGSDKQFAHKTFGPHGHKFSKTIGSALGQEERHGDDCFAAIKVVRSVRAKLESQEKALTAAHPEFAPYLKAKREMVQLEQKLTKSPAFGEHKKTRKELRGAVDKLNEEKRKCKRCSFATVVKATAATEPDRPVAAEQPAPQPPMNPVIAPGVVVPTTTVDNSGTTVTPSTTIGNPSDVRSVGVVGEGAA